MRSNPQKPGCNPRIRLHANGTATLSGIDVRDLRSILTKARLNCYEDDKKPRENECDEDKAWRRRIEWILDTADKVIVQRYHETYPHHNQPPTIAQRWESAREEKRTRQIIEEIFNEELAKRDLQESHENE